MHKISSNKADNFTNNGDATINAFATPGTNSVLLLQMSKLEDPEIKVKLAMVVTTYPGASAHQVELEVTDVLESFPLYCPKCKQGVIINAKEYTTSVIKGHGE